MSLVKFLPAWFHAIADYAVGGLLIIAALLTTSAPSKAVATGVVVGIVVLAVSMLTKYPLGVVKVLPFTIHSAGDYLAAALLIIAPFALGFSGSSGGLGAFYVIAGVAVLAVSLITNYQYSPARTAAAAHRLTHAVARGSPGRSGSESLAARAAGSDRAAPRQPGDHRSSFVWIRGAVQRPRVGCHARRRHSPHRRTTGQGLGARQRHHEDGRVQPRGC